MVHITRLEQVWVWVSAKWTSRRAAIHTHMGKNSFWWDPLHGAKFVLVFTESDGFICSSLANFTKSIEVNKRQYDCSIGNFLIQYEKLKTPRCMKLQFDKVFYKNRLNNIFV